MRVPRRSKLRVEILLRPQEEGRAPMGPSLGRVTAHDPHHKSKQSRLVATSSVRLDAESELCKLQDVIDVPSFSGSRHRTMTRRSVVMPKAGSGLKRGEDLHASRLPF